MITPTDGFKIETREADPWITLVAPCGNRRLSFGSEDLLNEYGAASMTKHAKSCKACKIVRGESKASVLPQDDIANLFRVGIDGKRSSTNHYHSDDGILTHYRTTEGVRTSDGVLIHNLQCWGGGFAKCSFWTEIGLPLSSLPTPDSRTIKILERSEDYTLFTALARLFQYEKGELVKDGIYYWLFGLDEGRRFLVRLAEPVSTIAAALESLKPEEARNRSDVVRQGDLFFIPVDPALDLSKLTTDKARFVPFDKVVGDRWAEPQTFVKSKRLYRPEITIGGDHVRHSAQELKVDSLETYARGWITHPQHHKVKLSQWCLVKRNTALQRIDASRRGGNGGAD